MLCISRSHALHGNALAWTLCVHGELPNAFQPHGRGASGAACSHAERGNKDVAPLIAHFLSGDFFSATPSSLSFAATSSAWVAGLTSLSMYRILPSLPM